jgi:ubiquinone/menaquinone biosynthesis C-methylase UbiE
MELDSQKTQSYFHRRARDFDSLYDEKNKLAYYINSYFRSGMYKRVELTIDEFEGLDNFSVLDVGCGSGRNSILFAKAGADRVLGIDFAENMLQLAREYSGQQNLSTQCTFLQADALTFNSPEKFEVSVALGVFDYLADPRPLLQKMKELSTSKVIGSFPRKSIVRQTQRKIRYGLKNCPVYFFDEKDLQAACKDVGLVNVRLVPYPSGFLLVGRVS